MSLRDLKEGDWKEILYQIDQHKCTPFIGAGACIDWLPLGSKIAIEMTKEYGYPLEDFNVLDRVSQYVAITEGDLYPKNFVARWFEKISIPDFSKKEYENTIHSILADFKLPLYITTNYDEFMESAIRARRREPVSEFCKWNQVLQKHSINNSVFKKKDYKLNQENPLVYHLHGNIKEVQSMVLTENDYLDFLIMLSKEEDMLPYQIKTALNSTSLLFVGYSLSDINFRFIFRGIMNMLKTGLGSVQHTSIAVQLPHGFTKEKEEQAIEYLNMYTKDMFKIKVYWGDINKFSYELKKRWDEYKNC